MAYSVIDPAEFLTDGILREEGFLQKVQAYDWERLRGQAVLVRGCTSTIIPPWVYMIITSHLSGVARSVRFGNEHDNIVVHRSQARPHGASQTSQPTTKES